MLPHIKGWNGTWMLWVMVIVWHSKDIRLFRGTGFCQYKQQLLKGAWMQLGTSYLVGGVSPQQYFHHSIESCTLLDWVRNPSTTCLSCVLLRKHDTRFTASADQHKLFERAEETWQRCSHAPLTGRIWLKSGLCLLQLWPTLIKIISEVYRKMCWLCFSFLFFSCVSVHFNSEDTHAYTVYRQGKDSHWFHQKVKILSVLTKEPHSLNWRGGSRFPQVAAMKSWQMEAAAVPR